MLNKEMLLSQSTRIFGNSKSAIFLIFLVFLSLGFYYGKWRTEKIIQWDTIVYYEYLTAAFMFNDISFEFAYSLPDDFDGDIWLETGPEGERYPKTTMGVAIMMTPTYLIAYFLNQIFNLGSYGYSSFFQFFIFLGALFHFIAGLVFLRKILKEFFSEKVVSITLVLLSFASGLLYYTGVDPGLSHVYSFFLFTCFIWINLCWHKKPTWKNSSWLGLVLGMIVLIRPSNAIIAILPLLIGISSIDSLKEKLSFLYKNSKKIILAVAVFAMVVFLQFWFWKYSTGKWFIYSYGDEGFFWNDPKIVQGLFGFRKGLFLYAPILIFALMGIFLKKEALKKLKLPFILFMIINTYVILSWWCWWYGGGFGHRSFVDSYAIFAIFLAVCVERVLAMKSRPVKISLVLLAAFMMFLSQFQINQYNKGHLHWDGMTYKAYKEIFLKTYTSPEFWNYLEQPDYEDAKKGIGR